MFMQINNNDYTVKAFNGLCNGLTDLNGCRRKSVQVRESVIGSVVGSAGEDYTLNGSSGLCIRMMNGIGLFFYIFGRESLVL